MPIYAYKCGSCGHAKDVLQKISDAPLDTCPVCGAVAFHKQVTAAGFQLKGSGWYATDFRNGSKPASTSGGDGGSADKADAGKTDASKTDSAKPADGAKKPADSTPSVTKSEPPSASAGSCGGGCACH